MDDIITSLFNIDCDEALQKIFIYLDAHSLKACRQVNRQWNYFIMNRIWKIPSRKRLFQEKVFNNFFDKEASEYTVVIDKNVKIQECLADNAICILSLSDGTIAVFDFSSRKIVKDLDCTSLAGRDHQLSLTDELIVAVSNDGDIFIWERQNFDLIFKDSEAHNSSIYGVKMLEDTLFTGDIEGTLNIFNVSKEEVVKKNTVKTGRRITHLDYDGTYLLIGSAQFLYLMTVDEKANLEEHVCIESGWIGSCSLSYPFAISTRSSGGAKIWDLRTGSLYKNILEDTNMHFFLHNVQNGILAIAPHHIHNRERTFLVDLRTIENETPRVKSFKDFQKQLFSWHYGVGVCLNDTKLVVGVGRFFVVKEFWYYHVQNDEEYIGIENLFTKGFL